MLVKRSHLLLCVLSAYPKQKVCSFTQINPGCTGKETHQLIFQSKRSMLCGAVSSFHYNWRCVLLCPSHFRSGWGIIYIYYFRLGYYRKPGPQLSELLCTFPLLFHIFQILQSQSVLMGQGIYSKALLHLCLTDNILFQASLRMIIRRSTENTIFVWQKVKWAQTPSHW